MSNPHETAQDVHINHGAPLVSVISEWFYGLLQRPDPESFWQSLEKKSYGLSDELCQDITSAPYIDVLRPKFEESESNFRQVEIIAERAEKYDAIKKYPYTIILLLSLARKFLTEGAKLYDLGLGSYEYYKSLAQSMDQGKNINADERLRVREIVLETGIQLYRREGELEKEDNIWRYLQLEFDYQEALFTRRMQFYQTDEPRKLFKLTTDRWTEESKNKKEPEKEKKYYALNQTSLEEHGAMHPQLLDLPVPYSSTNALLVAERISEALRDGKTESIQEEFNCGDLAKNLRIIQWDIFTRDLFDEQIEHKLSYKSSLAEKKISGLPPATFLDEVTKESWLAHCQYFPLHSGILRKRAQPGDSCPVLDMAERMPERLQRYRLGFTRLLNKALKYNPSSYDDVIEAFADREDGEATSKALLVEDGELTFFTFLWLLRHAVSFDEDPPEVWCKDPSAQLYVRFRPTDEETFNAWWQKKDLAYFAQLCGLLVPSHSGHYVLTRRWRSLIRWLLRQRKTLMGDGSLEQTHDKVVIHHALPVKKIAVTETPGTPEHDFALALQSFFTSPGLCEYLTNVRVFPDEIPIEEFAEKHIGPLIKLAGPILRTAHDQSFASADADEPWPHRDTVLIRMSRAGFLPLEYLFRTFQPYEMHLLMLALSFTRTELVGQKPAPVSLAFTTIAGALPPGVSRGMSYDTGGAAYTQQDTADMSQRTKARRWLAPYWTLFTALAAELSVGQAQRASQQVGVELGVEQGIEEILSAFSHEVGKISAYIFNQMFIKMGDMFLIEGVTNTAGASLEADEALWKKRVGELKPHANAGETPDWPADEISDWRVCPTPATLRSLRHLYSIWIGSKVTLKDFGVEPNDELKKVLNKIEPMAKEMAVARERAEQMNPIRSLKGARDTDEKTKKKIAGSAQIVPQFTPPAEQLRLQTTGTDSTDTFQKVFLARAILAALSNAIRYTAKGGVVTVKVRVDGNRVIIAIENPSAVLFPEGVDIEEAYNATIKAKSKFSLGTEAVMNTCARQLGGKGFLKPFRNENGILFFRSQIEFPLPETTGDETPWITL